MTYKRMGMGATLALYTELQARGMTLDEMAAFTGVSKAGCARWVKKMRADDSPTRLYVCGYADDVRGRPFVAIYRAGTMPDAPRPGQRRTAAERMAALRAARKVGAA